MHMRCSACISFLLFMLLGAIKASPQEGDYVVPDYKGMMESFFSVTDSVIRKEAGSFTFTGSIAGLTNKASLRQFELYSLTDHTITLALDDMKIHISRGPFFSAVHQIERFGPQGYVYRINGRPFWGFDGSVPNQRIVNVHFFDGDQRMELPGKAIRDIFEPNFCTRRGLFRQPECSSKAFVSDDGKRIYVYMKNSRKPSLYEVTWIISEGRYIGRIVDYAY